MKTPEHKLILFCRKLRRNYPELVRISFRVDREEGEYLTGTFQCREEPDDAQR